MGGGESKHRRPLQRQEEPQKERYDFKSIKDKFETIEESISPHHLNPYQYAIKILGETLSAFDDDGLIPVFGFGDKQTQDKTVFPFFPGLALPALARFELRGEAINIVKRERAYHILIIIADGQVTPDSEYCQAETETKNAIVEKTNQTNTQASHYPLSIILVGVGDGPWDSAEEQFDDGLPTRQFDNFQFVNFHKEVSYGGEEFGPAYFAVAALQEVPEQYEAIRKLELL
ncbi:RINGfinger protein [Acanthamoeba castellanii str. Neff]|uniref:RINGfinger protein n=1 Tax=Acanthamoeba castellanii (strain ATCC 30010 / Neff) TaxID=1257118 RepID=L8GJ66_ACACF|nr:RINGfinger protein [Acanthamoeba castellanii str. Neff]ELR13052.1 RINGfinger protein [Acanthamoeba castellanii str. Neff]